MKAYNFGHLVAQLHSFDTQRKSRIDFIIIIIINSKIATTENNIINSISNENLKLETTTKI